ncbi:MAG TPA: hypothetical protein VE619_02470 [Nitrososphaeraceae archaeon]|nr:hypothetical protein [Nitrososphaeraceae archaeon]
MHCNFDYRSNIKQNNATGAINRWPIMGVASVILGGMAMTMALLLKHQVEKFKLSPKLAIQLR